MMLFERIKTWLRDSHNLAALMLSMMPLVLICLYVVRYSVSYPDADDWVGPVDMAYDIKNGTFSAADIVEPTQGIHRAATYHVVLYLLVQLTDWNTHLVAYIMLLLGLLRLGILVMLFAETLPRRLFVVLLPFSALILAVDQANGWHTGIFMVWHFVSLFALAAVLVLKKAKPGWPALVGAAVLCGLATSSQGTGWFVSYPVLLVTLWMFGYRRPGYFVFWIVVSLIALRLYTLGLPGESGQTDVSIINKAANIHHLLMWIAAFLGNPFTTLLDRSLPFVVGSLGLIVMALNLFYLRRYEDNWQRVNAWIAVAGIGLAAAGATFIGQYNEDIIASSEDQLARLVSVAAPVRYSLSATHFWAALVALMVLTFWHHQRSNPDEIKLWQRSLIIGNVVFASLLGGLYMRETAWSLQFESILTGETIADDVGSRSEACFRQVALTRDPCWADTGEFDFFFDKNYKLAYYGLAHFRDHQAIPLLPPVYVEGSPVVIDTPAIWMNAYLRRWYLVGVGEANLFHIAPPADSIDTLADPLTDTAPDYSGDTPARLTAFIDRSETVWYLRTDETASNETIFTGILADLDYVPTVVPNSDYRINLHLTLIRFDKSPELLDESIRFGDAIRMVSWRIRAEDAESPACQPLMVQTWWQASETLTGNHQVRVTLVYEDGSIISESAGGLTTVPTLFWEPDQLYLDERVFFVTCDLSPGRYDLAVQVNEVDTGQPLNAGPGAILRDWMLPN